ncbi:FHA domain-containing protein [Streptomyces sp. GTA36]
MLSVLADVPVCGGGNLRWGIAEQPRRGRPRQKGPLTAMQIRLTVVDPLGTRPEGRPASCDVLVTAPAGTALAAVASGLASAVGGEGAGVLYAGAERLDAQRCTLGEPPLMDGAVLSLGSPAEPGPDLDPAAAQLRVVAGPDAGGVHFLHGGRIDIGRSADADVPLDDPDVSRLHCAVTVAADGRVSVADLGSTNGTTLDGRRVSERQVRFAPGALLRVGESALRLAPAGEPAVVRETAPDGEGHIRVVTAPETPEREQSTTTTAGRTGQQASAPGEAAGAARVPHARDGDDGGAPEAASRFQAAPPTGETHHGYGTAGVGLRRGRALPWGRWDPGLAPGAHARGPDRRARAGQGAADREQGLRSAFGGGPRGGPGRTRPPRGRPKGHSPPGDTRAPRCAQARRALRMGQAARGRPERRAGRGARRGVRRRL